MRFEGSLVFVNVALFEEQLQKLLASRAELKVLIIDGVSINDIDASGEEMLRESFKRLTEAGIYVLFTRFRVPIMNTFKRSHLFGDIDKNCFHRNPVNAFARAQELLAADDDEAGEEGDDGGKGPTKNPDPVPDNAADPAPAPASS
jgi:SulP family sulfate permease